MHVLCYFVKYSIVHVVSVLSSGNGYVLAIGRRSDIKLIEKRWSAPSFWLVHPGRLTWNIQITHLERKMIFQTIIFRFHVNLPGCTLSHYLLPGILHPPSMARIAIHHQGVPRGVNPAVKSVAICWLTPTPPALAAASPLVRYGAERSGDRGLWGGGVVAVGDMKC